MKNIFLEKSCKKCGRETSPDLFLKNWNLEYLWINISLYVQVEGYRNILKLRCTPIAFTSYKDFLENKNRSGTLPHFLLNFLKIYLSRNVLLTNQISLSDCLYFLTCWAVLWLFVSQFVTSWILKLTLAFLSWHFPTWPKK